MVVAANSGKTKIRLTLAHFSRIYTQDSSCSGVGAIYSRSPGYPWEAIASPFW
ncbi:hypothetical protein NC991_22820 [Funiculus sociatus GB1-A4]